MVIRTSIRGSGFGCFWGEVQTAIHKALGCRGLITDGGVRDLDAIAPEFQVLCGKVTPSHAWVHAIAFGGTVDVFGVVVRSDDLIHADRHGAVVIPHEVARAVAGAAELCARREAPILKVARSPDFSLDALERAMAEAAESVRQASSNWGRPISETSAPRGTADPTLCMRSFPSLANGGIRRRLPKTKRLRYWRTSRPAV